MSVPKTIRNLVLCNSTMMVIWILLMVFFSNELFVSAYDYYGSSDYGAPNPPTPVPTPWPPAPPTVWSG